MFCTERPVIRAFARHPSSDEEASHWEISTSICLTLPRARFMPIAKALTQIFQDVLVHEFQERFSQEEMRSLPFKATIDNVRDITAAVCEGVHLNDARDNRGDDSGQHNRFRALLEDHYAFEPDGLDNKPSSDISPDSTLLSMRLSCASRGIARELMQLLQTDGQAQAISTAMAHKLHVKAGLDMFARPRVDGGVTLNLFGSSTFQQNPSTSAMTRFNPYSVKDTRAHNIQRHVTFGDFLGAKWLLKHAQLIMILACSAVLFLGGVFVIVVLSMIPNDGEKLMLQADRSQCVLERQQKVSRTEGTFDPLERNGPASSRCLQCVMKALSRLGPRWTYKTAVHKECPEKSVYHAVDTNGNGGSTRDKAWDSEGLPTQPRPEDHLSGAFSEYGSMTPDTYIYQQNAQVKGQPHQRAEDNFTPNGRMQTDTRYRTSTPTDCNTSPCSTMSPPSLRRNIQEIHLGDKDDYEDTDDTHILHYPTPIRTRLAASRIRRAASTPIKIRRATSLCPFPGVRSDRNPPCRASTPDPRQLRSSVSRVSQMGSFGPMYQAEILRAQGWHSEPSSPAHHAGAARTRGTTGIRRNEEQNQGRIEVEEIDEIHQHS